jgi:hypothetical protein
MLYEGARTVEFEVKRLICAKSCKFGLRRYRIRHQENRPGHISPNIRAPFVICPYYQ